MIKWNGMDTSKFVKWNEEAETYLELLFKLIERDLVHDCLDLEGDTFSELLNYSAELEELNKNEDYDAIREFDFDALLESLTDDQIKSIILANQGNAYYQGFKELQEIKINGHTLLVSENTYHCLDAYLNHVENCQYYGIEYVDEANRLESYFISNLCVDNNVDILLDILERCECTSDGLIERLRTLTF